MSKWLAMMAAVVALGAVGCGGDDGGDGTNKGALGGNGGGGADPACVELIDACIDNETDFDAYVGPCGDEWDAYLTCDFQREDCGAALSAFKSCAASKCADGAHCFEND